VSDFATGKYLVFDIDNLRPYDVVRLRARNDYGIGGPLGQPNLPNPSPACIAAYGGTSFLAGYNAHISSVYVSGDICDPPRPSIRIRKNKDGPDYAWYDAGDKAKFEIEVKNTGNRDLTDVVVKDWQVPDCEKHIGTLKVGESKTYWCEVKAKWDFENLACVFAEYGKYNLKDCDTSTVKIKACVPHRHTPWCKHDKDWKDPCGGGDYWEWFWWCIFWR
jgi:hypothetical protein